MTYTGPKDFPVLDVTDVHDGDTFWLVVDQGLRTRRELNVRLEGHDTPEVSRRSDRKVSEFELKQGKAAREVTLDFLDRFTQAGTLHVVTEPDPKTWDRWVGNIYAVQGQTKVYLSALLRSQQLAVPSVAPTFQRWWQVYDRPTWVPGAPTA